MHQSSAVSRQSETHLSVQRLSRLRGKTAALLARVYVSRRSNVFILHSRSSGGHSNRFGQRRGEIIEAGLSRTACPTALRDRSPSQCNDHTSLYHTHAHVAPSGPPRTLDRHRTRFAVLRFRSRDKVLSSVKTGDEVLNKGE